MRLFPIHRHRFLRHAVPAWVPVLLRRKKCGERCALVKNCAEPDRNVYWFARRAMDNPAPNGGTALKIAMGNDHAALDFKNAIKAHLEKAGHEIVDCGTCTAERCDYPVYGEKTARLVAAGGADCGLLFCGTGIGISLAANRVKGIRAAVCSEPYSAVLSKQHNNTNILCLGARVVGIELAKMIVDMWLAAEFEGGVHKKRIDMIAAIVP